MAKVLKATGWLLALPAITLLGLILLAPDEIVERQHPTPQIETTADAIAILAEREAITPGITPGTEARILWAGEPGAATEISLLYLHGFSASSEEIRPVPDELAEALGANLIFARLRGHGRDAEAFGAAQAHEWVEDAALFLEIARAVGDRVLVLGTSTGATLAAYAVSEPDMAEDIAAIAMVSPNFALAHPAGRFIEWPGVRLWGPWLVGAEVDLEIINDDHARFFTTRYPTGVVAGLGALMVETRGRDFSGAEQPLLVLISEEDRVVSPDATRDFLASWGGDSRLHLIEMPEEGADPYNHVLAGEILSPDQSAEVTDLILQWAQEALN